MEYGMKYKSGKGGKSSLLKLGINEQDSFHGAPLSSVGMDTKGKDQKPQGIYKGTISTDRGKFMCK